MRDMWVSKRKWNKLNSRIRICEEKIREYEENTVILVRNTAKKILTQPDELREEMLNDENIEEFISNFLRLK